MRKARDVAAGSFTVPSRDRLCLGQQHWGSMPPTFTHMLLSIPLTLAGDLSLVEMASDKMKGTSRCRARASTDDSRRSHIPPRPRVTDPNGEGDPKPQEPLSD